TGSPFDCRRQPAKRQPHPRPRRPGAAAPLSHRQLMQRRLGLRKRTIVLTWPAKESLIARQYDGGHATAEIGHIHSAEAIYRSWVRPCCQHIGALDLLTVRACQHDTSAGCQADIKL